jgi:HlyD family secretion protein
MSGGTSDFMQVLQSAAKAGSNVKKGATVAEFDRQYQLTRLDDYKATVTQSEASLKSLDADLLVTRKAFDLSIEQARAAVAKAKLDIQTIPVRSEIQSEQLKLALEEAEANLKQLSAQSAFRLTSERAQRRNAELDLLQSKNELKRAEMNLNRMVINAPMDGMVVMQTAMRGSDMGQIQVGDQLMPGQFFMQIVDPRSMLVSATVNQADVEMVRVGARARLHFDAFPDMELPAKVIALGAMTRTGGMRDKFFKEVPVFLKIEKMDSRVIPDLSVGVDIIIEGAADSVIVPVESVFHETTDGKDYVFVRAEGQFTRREVTVGVRNNVSAAITSGLKPGDVVALEQPDMNSESPGGAGGEGNVQRS